MHRDSFVRKISSLALIATLLTTILPQDAYAAMAITSSSLNGSNSTTVTPGASVSVSMTLNLTSGDDWRSTGWRIADELDSNGSGGPSYTCFNTDDNETNSGSHSFTETFSITAPNIQDVYDVQLKAYDQNGCTDTPNVFVHKNNGITVSAPADTISPTVTNVTSSTANGSYNVPDVVSVQVTFSEVVIVTGTPRITLETGTTDKPANYTSGSNSTTLTFAYTVQAGDTSAVLDYVAINPLSQNGGSTIRDAAGNNATLTLAAPGAANSLGGNKNIIIDTTAPALAQVTPVPALTNDSTPNYTFSSTEAGSLVYAGGCTSATTNAVSGNNPVTFFVLADGTYASCTIRSTDAAGNQSNTLAVSSFDVDTVAPVITILGSNPQALGTGDTFVDAGATATDVHDGSVTPVASGSVNTATPGTYTITYTATDAAGNSSTATRAVNVSDDDAPTFSGIPTPMTIEATSAAGAIVTYTNPTANDNVDGDVSANVVCTPASGGTFSMGVTTVSCSVRDAANNAANTSFTVTVQDTTDPVITVTPGNQTLEATSPAGAVATFTVTATDNIDGDVTSSIICNRTSGSTFAIGINNVLCLARDAAGNVEGAPFTITVLDTTAPTITFNPSAVIVVTVSEISSEAHYTATATDLGDAAPSLSCSPVSGSIFPSGVSTVTCTATDASGNSATESTTVTVTTTSVTGGGTDVSPFENPAESSSTDETPVVPVPAPAAATPAPENTTPETEGEVLGESCVMLTSYVGMGKDVPDDVRFVQEFLNKELGLTIEANGTFDSATKEAVKMFQLKYIADILAPWVPFGHDGKTPTGFVYKTTQYKMNVLSCPGLDIQKPELP